MFTISVLEWIKYLISVTQMLIGIYVKFEQRDTLCFDGYRYEHVHLNLNTVSKLDST